MSRISIPFLPEFRLKIRNGQKTMTTRTRQCGQVGDTFLAFGAECEIVDIRLVPLGLVQREYWQSEGAESRRDFEAIWNRIHPKRRFDSGQMVYLHVWQRVRVSPPAEEGERR